MNYQNYQQFPQSYQQPYQYYNQVSNNYQTQNIPLKFDIVQGGRLAVDMYQLENGQEAILVDMDNPYLYKKKRGIDGKLEPLKTFKLVEVTDAEETNSKEYVKQEEIESLIEQAVKSEVEKRLSEMTLKPSTRKTKTEVEK